MNAMESIKRIKINIVGAGISGLIAAINMEKFGYQTTLLEADSIAGGRVQTDIVDGYQLDHGFQVLLDAYPMVNEYLDTEALELQKLSPGAVLFESGKGTAFGDPLRESRYLFSTLFSSVATISDKIKILKLRNTLRKKNIREIFESDQVSTNEYLHKHGFSESVISHFFSPFFSGIFLENRLTTSSRMFEFVYKMFSEGSATIPKAGMKAIPEQLVSLLHHSKIIYNARVSNVSGNGIELEDGTYLEGDFTIVATDPEKIINNYISSLQWKSCDNLYFTTKTRIIDKPIIGLKSINNGYVNNIFYPTSIGTSTKGDNELLSVTVVKDHELGEEELTKAVQKELNEHFGIENLRFLKQYRIKKALPIVEGVSYQRDASESQLTEQIALAGDHLLNGSLNAAMQSGESAAQIAHHYCQTSLTHAN